MVVALKRLSGNADTCQLGVGVYESVVFTQFGVILVLGVMSGFLWKPGHWGRMSGDWISHPALFGGLSYSSSGEAGVGGAARAGSPGPPLSLCGHRGKK